MQRALVIFMHYSRISMHTGGCRNVALFSSTCMHVVVILPTNSKPGSQVQVVVSPTVVLVTVHMPFSMTSGEHSAAEKV